MNNTNLLIGISVLILVAGTIGFAPVKKDTGVQTAKVVNSNIQKERIYISMTGKTYKIFDGKIYQDIETGMLYDSFHIPE